MVVSAGRNFFRPSALDRGRLARHRADIHELYPQALDCQQRLQYLAIKIPFR